MTLADYLAQPGRSKAALARAVGVRWQTLHEIAEGRTTPRPATALAIEQATDGEVSAAALLGLNGAPTPATGTDG